MRDFDAPVLGALIQPKTMFHPYANCELVDKAYKSRRIDIGTCPKQDAYLVNISMGMQIYLSKIKNRPHTHTKPIEDL